MQTNLSYILPPLRPPPPYLSRLCRLFLNLLPLPLKSKCIIYSNLPKCIPTHNYIICFDWNSHLCSFQSLQFFDDLHISLFSCRILFTRSDSSLLRIIFPALPLSSTTLLRIEENAVEKDFVNMLDPWSLISCFFSIENLRLHEMPFLLISYILGWFCSGRIQRTVPQQNV